MRVGSREKLVCCRYRIYGVMHVQEISEDYGACSAQVAFLRFIHALWPALWKWDRRECSPLWQWTSTIWTEKERLPAAARLHACSWLQPGLQSNATPQQSSYGLSRDHQGRQHLFCLCLRFLLRKLNREGGGRRGEWGGEEADEGVEQELTIQFNIVVWLWYQHCFSAKSFSSKQSHQADQECISAMSNEWEDKTITLSCAL